LGEDPAHRPEDRRTPLFVRQSTLLAHGRFDSVVSVYLLTREVKGYFGLRSAGAGPRLPGRIGSPCLDLARFAGSCDTSAPARATRPAAGGVLGRAFDGRDRATPAGRRARPALALALGCSGGGRSDRRGRAGRGPQPDRLG